MGSNHRGECESISLEFAIEDTSRNEGATVNLRILQEGLAPVEGAVQRGSIGQLETELNGSSFQVEGNSTSGGSVRIRGTAMCQA